MKRWWVYQRERFPVVQHGLLIAAFSFSAVCFSALLRGSADLPPAKAVLVAYGTAFLFFLQLRIADEHKDFEEDARWRPYRPVPRGLVTLRELAGLGGLAALVQLGLALWLDPSLVVLLAVTWTYLALMSKEFFVAGWLKDRHVLYLVSHMAIVPLVDFYATACDWWPSGEGTPPGLGWFVAVSYFNGIVIEVGRKVRAPADEEPGVNTYSALWGRRTATAVWLGALMTTAGLAAVAAYQIDWLVPMLAVLAVLLSLAGLVAARFLRDPAPGEGKLIENLSGLWTLLMYLGLGAAPLLYRWWTSTGRA
jgi:4-hydroxybenzoate polyprenyltransferase